MADLPISGLPPASALDGSEKTAIVQGGVTKECSTQDIADLANITAPITTLTKTAFDALVGASGLTIGQWYLVTSAYPSVVFAQTFDVLCFADATNTVKSSAFVVLTNQLIPCEYDWITPKIKFFDTNKSLTITPTIADTWASVNDEIYPGSRVFIDGGSGVIYLAYCNVDITILILTNVLNFDSGLIGTYNPATNTFTPNSSGSGDVVGPASAVNNNIVLFDGTTGKSIKDSGASLGSYVPYTGATGDVDLGTNGIDAKFVKVKGTGGNGKLGLKHQTSGATASASESVLYADNSGNPAWKNDGNALRGIQLDNSAATATNYTTPLDADKIGIWDTLNSLFKAVTWANIKATLKTYFDTLYAPITNPSISLITTNGSASPAASTTYFYPLAGGLGATWLTASTTVLISFPEARTLRQVIVQHTNVSGTAGSADNVPLTLRNETTATNSTIGNIQTNQASGVSKMFNFTGLSIAVAANDNVCLRMATPAWGTPPTTAIIRVTTIWS